MAIIMKGIQSMLPMDKTIAFEALAQENEELRRRNNALEREKRRVGISFRRIHEKGEQITPLVAGMYPTFKLNSNLSYSKDNRFADYGEGALMGGGSISLIEGDNLPVLMALYTTHKESVNVIYIDPPYNTGNSDFIYNDRRISSVEDVTVDGKQAYLTDYEITASLDGGRIIGQTDPERHSTWLSFMERRLVVGRELLADSGVIMISIDENEHHRLRSLLDQIFGEKNFVADLVWAGKTGGADDNFYAKKQEYVLVYAKNKDKFEAGRLPTNETDYRYAMPDGRKYKTQLLRKWGSNSLRENGPTMFYPIPAPDGTDLYPLHGNGTEGCWRWGKTHMADVLANDPDKVFFEKNKEGAWVAYERLFYDPERNNPYSTFIDKEVAITATGSKELASILGKGHFSYPKSTALLEHLLKMAGVGNDKNAVILDFFAGSGTTGHAVANLNATDVGTRQCILVTHGDENGKNIAADVTAVRLCRALSGRDWADGNGHPQLPGVFSYYTLEFIRRGSRTSELTRIAPTVSNQIAIKEGLNVVSVADGFDVLESTSMLAVVVKDPELLYIGSEKLNATLGEFKANAGGGRTLQLWLPSTDGFNTYDFVIDGWDEHFYAGQFVAEYDKLLSRMKTRNLIETPKIEQGKSI